MKVLKFRDGADVFVVPESEVESAGSFSPDGATLTLKSGQEVTVDRRSGVETLYVESVEEMIKLVVNKETKNGIQTKHSKPVKSGGGGEVSEVPSKRGGERGQRGRYIIS
jgi:hypothetical protein